MVESLEQRQLLSSDALTLHTGYICLCPTDANVVQVYASTTATGTPEHSYTRSDLTSLIIHGTTGDDTLTIDFSHGTPFKDNVLTYYAGLGHDTLNLIGRATIRATINPSPTAARRGS
ncbi:MAG: hypothetical protein ABSH20_16665, partial [Tepidisphaeraceae bacterium]